MRVCISSFLLTSSFLASGAFAATLTTGDGSVSIVNGAFGGLIEAGRSSTGTVTINGGSAVTLISGSSPDELESRPKIDVGDVDSGGGDGVVTITGTGTIVNLQGTSSGSKLEVGTYTGNTGTLKVLNGATINMTDDGPLSGDDNENVILQFGEDQAVGKLEMNKGSINASGSSNVGILVGIEGNTSLGGHGSIDMVDSAIDLNAFGDGDNAFIVVGSTGTGLGTINLDNSTIDFSASDRPTYFSAGSGGGNGALFLENGSLLSFAGQTQTVEVSTNAGSSGNIRLASGSVATFSSDEMEFNIGRSAGSQGNVEVDGGSTANVLGSSGQIQIGAQTSTLSVGEGLLSISDGSNFNSTVGVQIGSAFSSTNNQKGQIALDDGTISAPEVVIGTGGSVVGNGTVDAIKTVLSGGTISPGLSPGKIEFTGDLLVTGGSFVFEIGGNSPSQYDSVGVGGVLSATKAFDLIIKNIGGYVPLQTDTFELFSAGLIDSEFLSFAHVTSEFPYAFSLNDGGLSVSFTPVAPVPLPDGILLLATAIAGIGFLRSRTFWGEPKRIRGLCQNKQA